MKDGRTHLAHKAEHAGDVDTGPVVAVTVQAADTGDTTSMVETVIVAAELVETVQPEGSGIEEVVGDKGYHSNRTLTDLRVPGLRSYIAEPDRGCRCWKGRSKARDAVYGNRRRVRGELLERPFVNVCETGGMRRVHLREHPNMLQRLLAQFAGCNFGLLLRQLIGVGTPRSLQRRATAVFSALFRWWAIIAFAVTCERGDFHLALLPDPPLVRRRPATPRERRGRHRGLLWSHPGPRRP